MCGIKITKIHTHSSLEGSPRPIALHPASQRSRASHVSVPASARSTSYHSLTPKPAEYIPAYAPPPSNSVPRIIHVSEPPRRSGDRVSFVEDTNRRSYTSVHSQRHTQRVRRNSRHSQHGNENIVFVETARRSRSVSQGQRRDAERSRSRREIDAVERGGEGTFLTPDAGVLPESREPTEREGRKLTIVDTLTNGAAEYARLEEPRRERSRSITYGTNPKASGRVGVERQRTVFEEEDGRRKEVYQTEGAK